MHPGSWQYVNPVTVTFGAGCFAHIGAAVAGRRYALFTYPDEPFADLSRDLVRRLGEPVAAINDIRPNPDFHCLAAMCARLAAADFEPEVIVALGGGSVLDAAKVAAAAGSDFARVRAYLEAGIGETGDGADGLRFTPIVAVPTTAGTGSEVTSWATVWDNDAKRKYSLAHPRLYPERALIDPALTLGAPREVTLAAGLDALSHALESLWNINANPVSTTLAVSAARTILEALPRLVDDRECLELRVEMSRASLLAGLAFSNTRTALAHSLSYQITLEQHVSHGIACSFSLPFVMRLAVGRDADCDARLRLVFGEDLAAGAEMLETFLTELGVSTNYSDYGIPDDQWRNLLSQALEGVRGRNFIARPEPAVQ